MSEGATELFNWSPGEDTHQWVEKVHPVQSWPFSISGIKTSFSSGPEHSTKMVSLCLALS